MSHAVLAQVVAQLALDSHLPPPLHAPENNHVASAHSHWNTFVPQTKAANRIAKSAGPTQPITSVPCCMIVSMLLDPTGVSTLRVTRGVGLGGTNQVATAVGVGVSSGGSCASHSTPAIWTMISLSGKVKRKRGSNQSRVFVCASLGGGGSRCVKGHGSRRFVRAAFAFYLGHHIV